MIHLLSAVILLALSGLFAKISSDGGFLGARYFEKIGSGLLFAGFGLLYHIPWYYCLAAVVVNFIIRCLPLTFKGSSIWNAAWWVPIVSYLNGLIPMTLGLPSKWLISLELAFGYMVMASIVIFSSNAHLTADKAKWTWVRTFNGVILGLIAWFTLVGGI